jgi:hypothetical protein
LYTLHRGRAQLAQRSYL